MNLLLSAHEEYTCYNQSNPNQRQPGPSRNTYDEQKRADGNQGYTKNVQKWFLFTRISFRVCTLFLAKQLITSDTIYSFQK